MADTTAKQFILAALIFGVVLAGMFTLISSAIPSGSSSDFQNTNISISKFQRFENQSNDLTNAIKDTEVTTGPLGVIEGLYEITIGAFQLIWSSFATLTSLINDFSQGALGIQIPVWFTGFFIASIGIIIAFALMAAWFKWRI